MAKTGDLFDNILENALDFADTSIRQLQDSPKQSLINFAAFVELVLKARLLREHWSLVVEKPGSVSLQQFQAGEFRSVTTKETLARLDKVVGERLTPAEQSCFEELTIATSSSISSTPTTCPPRRRPFRMSWPSNAGRGSSCTTCF